jgi:formate-dependent nitrite reductase membrane component NrfD
MEGLLRSPHWPLLIDVYFFLGGIAGGAFVVATIANLLDGARYRAVVRIGYYLALLALLPCPILLIADLGVPARFINMLLAFNTTSPMSMGAWALLGFSAMAFLAALFTFLQDTRRAGDLSGPTRIVGIVGAFFGFFLAAYPGVLLGASARPLWTHGHVLGALFLAVGASTGAAAIALVLWALRRSTDLVSRVSTVMVVALLVQLVTLVIFLVAVTMSGSVAAARALDLLLSGPLGTTFWGGAILVGLVLPLILGGMAIRRGSAGLVAASAVLVLIGGFAVKYAIMAAGQA